LIREIDNLKVYIGKLNLIEKIS